MLIISSPKIWYTIKTRNWHVNTNILLNRIKHLHSGESNTECNCTKLLKVKTQTNKLPAPPPELTWKTKYRYLKDPWSEDRLRDQRRPPGFENKATKPAQPLRSQQSTTTREPVNRAGLSGASEWAGRTHLTSVGGPAKCEHWCEGVMKGGGVKRAAPRTPTFWLAANINIHYTVIPL